MITNQEIVDTYLAYKGMKQSDPEHRDDVRFLMPFYLMDASYQMYCKDIKDVECKHELKLIKNRWKESYRKFNAEFFKAFNEEQTDFIVDQMDEFEEYINNRIVILKVTVMGVFEAEATFEERNILSATLTSNALSQIAQHIYRDMYRDKWMRPKDNPLIEAVSKNSYEYARHFPVTKYVNLTASEKVSAQIDTLCKEVIRFLKIKLYEAQSK